MTVASAMPVVNAKARARTTKIFFIIVSPLQGGPCQNRLGASATTITFWSFFGQSRPATGKKKATKLCGLSQRKTTASFATAS